MKNKKRISVDKVSGGLSFAGDVDVAGSADLHDGSKSSSNRMTNEDITTKKTTVEAHLDITI